MAAARFDIRHLGSRDWACYRLPVSWRGVIGFGHHSVNQTRLYYLVCHSLLQIPVDCHFVVRAHCMEVIIGSQDLNVNIFCVACGVGSIRKFPNKKKHLKVLLFYHKIEFCIDMLPVTKMSESVVAHSRSRSMTLT